MPGPLSQGWGRKWGNRGPDQLVPQGLQSRAALLVFQIKARGWAFAFPTVTFMGDRLSGDEEWPQELSSLPRKALAGRGSAVSAKWSEVLAAGAGEGVRGEGGGAGVRRGIREEAHCSEG